ncbi:MAG: GNAT family N-acetyltransferase [Deltaproteobacteria bacterium]|nr:GNAT family N-acetyltransferase [Deltaproteobacteria bacterium]
MHSEAVSPSLLVPTIRSAKPEEKSALAEVINTAFRVEERYIPGPRIDVDEAAARLRNGRFLVADSGAEPAGVVFVDTHPSIGRIELLAVRPEHQGRGIGRRLLDVAESLCRAEGCRAVELQVIDVRRELVQLCKRKGYHIDGQVQVEGTTRVPWHFVVMHKRLTASKDG